MDEVSPSFQSLVKDPLWVPSPLNKPSVTRLTCPTSNTGKPSCGWAKGLYLEHVSNQHPSLGRDTVQRLARPHHRQLPATLSACGTTMGNACWSWAASRGTDHHLPGDRTGPLACRPRRSAD